MLRFGLSEDCKKFQAEKFEGFENEAKAIDGIKENERIAIILDVETTGLDVQSDEIIEIGARKIVFNKENGELVLIGPAFEAMSEPSCSLSPYITKLTGLTDDDLRGKSIDWAAFDEYVGNAVILVSHNASFDRPFVDKKSEMSRSSIWGCSAKQVSWRDWFWSANLQSLALYHAFFYDGHRALIDVDALIKLLGFSAPDGYEGTYLSQLLENAKKPTYFVYATNSSFETKDILKRNRYRWYNIKRVWRKEVVESDLEIEKEFLSKQVYGGDGFKGVIEKIPMRERFKSVFTGV